LNIRRNSKVSLLSSAIVLAGLSLCPDLALAETAEPVGPGTSDPVTADVVLEVSDDVLLAPEPIPLEGISVEANDLAPPAAMPTSPERPPEADLAQTTAPASPPAAQPGLAERSRLTGDWGGTRTQWEAAGITLDLEFTQYLQGLAAGTGPETFGYGGRFDGYVELDTEKLDWWDGGRLNAHLEYNFGSLPGTLGTTFFPTNAGMGFPGGGPGVLTATSLYLSQQLGSQGSLLIGKINALDLLENDLFFGGLGIRRFQNTVFVAPPSGLVPPVFFGAIANLRLDPITLSLWVYDPEDRTQEYWPSGLFSTGVTVSFTTSYATEIAERPTTFSITGIYSTKAGTDFSSISESFRQDLAPLTATGAYSIGFQASHLLYQLPDNPRQGWGLFAKGAIADGNPNYVQSSIIVGVGGVGLFPGRELDSFGVGYYYYNLSDALQDSLNELGQPVSFGDEQGFEAYYSYAVTPWFFFTGDVQYISPPRSTVADALVLGLRANIRF
jgi:porin